MSRKVKVVLAAGCCVIAIMVVGYIQGWYRSETKPTSMALVQNLANHPVYSRYSFGKADEDVIDFGTQPLGVPLGVISEAIRYDAVLMKALKDQGLEMRFHPFLKGADLNFFLRRGDVEVALGGDMPALSAAATSQLSYQLGRNYHE